MDRPVIFATEPDWPALRQAYVGSGLLHFDVALFDIAPHIRGSVCLLAEPFGLTDVEARRWLLQLILADCVAISPAMQRAQMLREDFDAVLEAGQRFWADHARRLMRAASVVVVPPHAGALESPFVWQIACQAIRSNKRVVVLSSELEGRAPELIERDPLARSLT